MILIDSPNPLNHVPLSLPLIEDIIDNSIKRNSDIDIREFCKSQFTTNAKLLSEYDPYKILANLNEGLPLRLVCLVCRDGYNSPTTSCVDVPSWLSDRGDITTIPKGWELVSGSVVQALDIPGHHFEPFQPHNVSDFRFVQIFLFFFFPSSFYYYYQGSIIFVHSSRSSRSLLVLQKRVKC